MFVTMNGGDRSEAQERSLAEAGSILSSSFAHRFCMLCGLQIVWIQENASPCFRKCSKTHPQNLASTWLLTVLVMNPVAKTQHHHRLGRSLHRVHNMRNRTRHNHPLHSVQDVCIAYVWTKNETCCCIPANIWLFVCAECAQRLHRCPLCRLLISSSAFFFNIPIFLLIFK